MTVQEKVTSPDDVIHELGGCGRFQIRMIVLVHLMKTITCWSSTVLVFVAAIPQWRCIDDSVDNSLSDTNITLEKSCKTLNGTPCAKFEFSPGMRTIVSEVIVILVLPSLIAFRQHILAHQIRISDILPWIENLILPMLSYPGYQCGLHTLVVLELTHMVVK